MASTKQPTLPESIKVTFETEEEHHAFRDAVDALSGPPHRLSITGVIREAIRREVRRLQRLHNKGRAFPRRRGS